MLCAECGETLAGSTATTCSACGAEPLLRGRYRLERVLGENVGTTYLAEDTARGTPVVVKELAFGRLDSWKTEELFQRETQTLRQLDHPRIPDYIEHFTLGQGKRQRFYLVQQHLDGRDLRHELSERRYTEEQVLDVLDEVLELLEYLQRLRPPLIHRDIKPSNLLRLRDGHLALIDFGAVRDLLAPPGDTPTVAGTFGFMAPEQFQGDAYLQTDLYGLGGVALQLLTQRSPEQLLAGTMQLAWREHVAVSPPLERLLARLLAPDHRERPASATDARTLLAQVRGELRAPARQERPSRESEVRRRRRSRRSRVRGAILGAGAVTGLLLGVLVITSDPARRRTVARPPVARRAARPPQPSRPQAPPPVATPPAPALPRISAAELTQVLLARRWKGTLRGTLVFRRGAQGRLQAQLVDSKGVLGRFGSVEPGPLGSVVLEQQVRQGDVTITTTFYGALSADHKTLGGSYEQAHRSGGEEHVAKGNWQVAALPPAERPGAR